MNNNSDCNYDWKILKFRKMSCDIGLKIDCFSKKKKILIGEIYPPDLFIFKVKIPKNIKELEDVSIIILKYGSTS